MTSNDISQDKKHISIFQWQFDYLITQQKMADNKINFLLVVYLSLLGIFLTQIERFLTFIESDLICLIWKLIVSIICLGYIFLNYRFFDNYIKAIKPRIDPRKLLKDSKYISCIFWGDIADHGFNKYANCNIGDLHKDIKKQIYVNSIIAKEKFQNVYRAYSELIFTLIIFITMLAAIILFLENSKSDSPIPESLEISFISIKGAK